MFKKKKKEEEVVNWKSSVFEELGKQIMKKKKFEPPQKQHTETLKMKDRSSFIFFLRQTTAYVCMKPLCDGFVWAHWDEMHVINFLRLGV